MNRSSSIVNIDTISEAEIDIQINKNRKKKLSGFDLEHLDERNSKDLNLHFKKELENDPQKINLNSSLPTQTHRYQSTKRNQLNDTFSSEGWKLI